MKRGFMTKILLTVAVLFFCQVGKAEFVVTHFRFNRGIENLDDVWACITDPSSWIGTPATRTYAAFSFESQPLSARVHSEFKPYALPGFKKITEHAANMAIQAYAIVKIPDAGLWSFDCGHDDGFAVTISGCGQAFSFQDERNSAYTHTTRVYNIAVPGVYSISIVGYEVDGGMICDLSVAKGDHRRFDAAKFKLLGTVESEIVFFVNKSSVNADNATGNQANALEQSAGRFWLTVPLSTNDGYTWSLTSRIGDMLQEAEMMFGPRDKSWTILGAEMRKDDTNPQNWYPGYPRRKDIVFQLGPSATKGECFAYYQLAHEVVHALAPEVGKRATVIEEGVAAWFAKRYVKNAIGEDMHAGATNYQKAEDAVDRLLKSDPDAIRKLRSVEPCFGRMKSQTFHAAKVTASKEDVENLLSVFH